MNCREIPLIRSRVLAVTGILLGSSLQLVAQELAPVPPDAAQQEAVKLIEEVYGEEHAKAKTSTAKTALANKLLKEATASEDLTNRYVLLRVARDMATQAGDAGTAVRAVEEIGKSFQVDLFQLKGAALSEARKSASLTEQREALAEQALALIEDAVARDDFVAAKYLGQLALDSARKARERDLTKRIVARNKTVTEVAEAYSETKDAFQTLEESPTDPEANLAAGRYLCFMKGDWEKGMPMLALGKDGQTTKLAIKELKGITDVEGQVALGDGWWELAETKDGLTKERARERAAVWYRLACPKLSGLAKSKVETRLQQLEPKSPPKPQTVAKSPPKPQTVASQHYFDPKTLGKVMFLDYVDNTWKNDIRPSFHIQKVPSGYGVVCNVDTGFDEKMILFPDEEVSTKKLVAAFTVARGHCKVSLRPKDLAPKGTTCTPLAAGKTYGVEVWIENGTARGTVNGQPMVIGHNDPGNYGYYSLMLYRRSSIVFHKLHFVSLE